MPFFYQGFERPVQDHRGSIAQSANRRHLPAEPAVPAAAAAGSARRPAAEDVAATTVRTPGVSPAPKPPC